MKVKKLISFLLVLALTSTSFNIINYSAHADETNTYELASGGSGDSVLAVYNSEKNLITISGSGTILEDNWKALAHAVEGGQTSFTRMDITDDGQDNPQEYGWQIPTDINMVFTAGSEIRFDQNGFNWIPYGWFQDFPGTIKFNNTINTDNLIDMSFMFERASKFNDDISGWNVSNAQFMSKMFCDATSFNKDLANWNTQNVKTMWAMFCHASVFNGDISRWDTGNVDDMSFMFNGASDFNGDISKWDTSEVTKMASMFYKADDFNGDVSAWNTSKVNNMNYMFREASSFNGDISTWDTSKVSNMHCMFYGASSFNSDISAWDTGDVNDISYMFYGSDSMKNINLLNKNKSGLAKADSFLSEASPYTVKFDKLTAFSWELPDKYKIKKGDEGSQLVTYANKNDVINFDADTRYELYKLGIVPDISIDDSIVLAYDGEAVLIDDLSPFINTKGVDGSLSFKDESLVIKDLGTYNLELVFTPSDSEMYESVELNVNIEIKNLNTGGDIVSSQESESEEEQNADLSKSKEEENKEGKTEEPASKLVERASFEFQVETVNTDGSNEENSLSQEVVLDKGVVKLTIDSAEEGAKAKLDVKPKTGYSVSKVNFYDGNGDIVEYVIDEEGLFNILIPQGTLSVDVKFDFILPKKASFEDVPLEHPWALEIEYLHSRNILDGLVGKRFKPLSLIKRASVIKILYNIDGIVSEYEASSFEDLELGAWYYNALQWAQQNEVAKGYSKTVFAPLKEINKEEFVAFLYRYEMKEQAIEDESVDLGMYSDGNKVSAYARTAIKWALENQIIEVNDKGEILPQESLTRAETARLIYRYLEK